MRWRAACRWSRRFSAAPTAYCAAGQLSSRWTSRWCRWAIASIRGRCGSPTSRCGPRSIRRACGEQMRRIYDDRAANARRSAAAAARQRWRDFSWARAADRLIEITDELRARPAERPAADGRDRASAGRALALLARPAGQRGRADSQPEREADGLPRCARAPVGPAAGVRGRRRRRRVDRWHAARRWTAQSVSVRAPVLPRRTAAVPAPRATSAIEQAAGELVLFIGDDILADERLHRGAPARACRRAGSGSGDPRTHRLAADDDAERA